MARPTVSIGSKITSNGTTQTPPSNARGMIVFCWGNPQAETATFTHTMSGVTFGGAALSAASAPANNSGHVCGWYLHNYGAFRGRSSNTLSFSGGTMSTSGSANTYHAYVVWVMHPTHTVVMAGNAGAASNVSAGSSLTVTPAPGAGVECVSICAFQKANSATSTVVSGQTSILSVGEVFKTSQCSWEDVTGSHAVGYNITATGGFNRCANSSAVFREGVAIPKTRGKVWLLGALPSLALPKLPMGLLAARSIPAGV